MTAILITKKVYRCTCELPDCPGKGKPWDTKTDKIPDRCSYCKKHSWNGDDARTKDGVSLNIADPDKKRRRRKKAVKIDLPKPKKVRSYE